MREAVRLSFWVCTVIFLGVLMASCGGDEGASQPVASAPPPPTPSPPPAANPPSGANAAPTIGGAPQGSVMQGGLYDFVPTAADVDGDTLIFSIENMPPWATFNSSTGRLRGTPSAADVGTYANIRISVSDGTATRSLASFSVQVVATALGSATLTWIPPVQRSDGTPLVDLAGFKVYWGTTQGNYSQSALISNPGVTSYVVENLTPATWFFATTAVDSSGIESAFSNVASKTIL